MLAVITCYFNPNNDKFRLENYKKFRENIKLSKVDLYTIELSIKGREFELSEEDAECLIQVESNSLMFQKERMLNILIEKLPDKYDSICWIDCDIVFLQSGWVSRIEESLKKNVIIQPFQYAVSLSNGTLDRLNENTILLDRCSGSSMIRCGFVYYRQATHGENLHNGHVGYAWAARADLLKKHKLYDSIITGCGDLFMIAAFLGMPDWIESLEDIKYMSDPASFHYYDWAFPIMNDIEGRIGYTEDLILHLWHGEIFKRNYLADSKILQKCKFDPKIDLKISDNGSFEWNSDKTELHSNIESMFYNHVN